MGIREFKKRWRRKKVGGVINWKVQLTQVLPLSFRIFPNLILNLANRRRNINTVKILYRQKWQENYTEHKFANSSRVESNESLMKSVGLRMVSKS